MKASNASVNMNIHTSNNKKLVWLEKFFVILLIVNICSQTFFNKNFSEIDLLVGSLLLVYLFFVNIGGFKVTKSETIVTLFIVLFSIVALFLSYDKNYSAKRLFTLIIQIYFIFFHNKLFINQKSISVHSNYFYF